MKKNIDVYIYEISRGLYFMSVQEAGIIRATMNPNYALQFVPSEEVNLKMTSFFTNADSSVEKLSGRFVKLKKAKQKYQKSIVKTDTRE